MRCCGGHWYVTKIPLSQRTCQSSHWGHTWQMASSCREPPHPAHACFQDGSMHATLIDVAYKSVSNPGQRWKAVWPPELLQGWLRCCLGLHHSFTLCPVLFFPLPSTGMDSRALPNKHPAHGSPSQERLLRESNLHRCWELMLTNFAQHMKSFNLENNPVRYVELSSIYREGNWGFKRSSRQQLNCFWVYTQVCLAAELMGWRIILVGEEGRLK